MLSDISISIQRACAALTLVASASAAQSRPQAVTPRARPPAVAFDDASTRRVAPTLTRDDARPAKADVVSPVLIVRSAPRAFQVVRIPVPTEIGAGRLTRYTMYPTGVAPILGKLDGMITAGASSRTVLVTVAVPADARAGLSTVGSVYFSAIGMPSVEVPIAIDVTPTRRIELTINETVRGVQPGNRFALSYQLMNLGNAADTVSVRFTVPDGWRVENGDGMTALLPGGLATRTAQVSVPHNAGIGTQSLQLIALSHGAPIASTTALIEIVSASGRRNGSARGPSLQVAVVGARGPWDGMQTGVSYALDGHVSDNVRVAARVMTGPSPTSAGGMALARSGVIAMQPSVTLYSPTWRASIGPVGSSLGDLTGAAVGGQGMSFDVTRSTWSVSGLAARPMRWGTGAGVGTDAKYAQLGRRAGQLRLTTTVSSLRESLGPLGAPRRLDALSAGLQFGTDMHRIVNSELAYRRYEGGAGLGASAGIALRGRRGSLEMRGTHAAGGTRAFARGTNEFTASANRQLWSWLGVNGSTWRVDDANGTTRNMESSGWTVGTTARLGRTVSLDLGGRGFGYQSAAATGRFGSTDRTAFGSLNARAGVFTGSLDGMAGARSRSMSGIASAVIVDRSPIARMSANVGASGHAGAITLSGAVTDNGLAAGFPARQLELRAQVEQLPLFSMRGLRLVAGGSAARMTSFVTPGAWISTMRATLTAQLPLGIALQLESERNPLFFVGGASAQDPNRWVHITRLQRAVALPRITRGARVEGVVFNDVNGNGRRERDEVAVGGIVLRRGAETILTGKDGRYRFAGATTEAVSVDARSLPMGWITTTESRLGGGDVPLLALAAVDVRLFVAPVDSSRVTRDDLARTVVTARDSSGRTWMARSVTSELARFDALPPGRYTVGADFSQAQEPLRVAGAQPDFLVGESAVPVVRLTVQPRPLRFPVARKAGADSVRGAGGPASPSASNPRSQR